MSADRRAARRDRLEVELDALERKLCRRPGLGGYGRMSTEERAQARRLADEAQAVGLVDVATCAADLLTYDNRSR